MNIQPNWTVTDQGPWQLIYNDTSIISLLEVEGITSTQGYVFAGTKEECDAEIIRLNLPWASEFVSSVDEENIEPTVVTETIYKLIHDGANVLYYSINNELANNIQEGQQEFIGTPEECEAEIARLELTWSLAEYSE
jgi:hypothetical protein